MSFVLFLLGCGSGPETACREGTTLHEDGHCYPPLLEFPPQLNDVRDGLPDCEPVQGDTIDIARGCLGETCVGDTFEEMEAVLGEEVDCDTASFNNREVVCEWEELGVDVRFPDDNQNGNPDTDSGAIRFRLTAPNNTDATASGIGIGANTKCFFEALGNPDRFVAIDVAGELTMQDLLWDRLSFFAYDRGLDDESGVPDGYVDEILFFGEP